MRDTIFVSYAHADLDRLEELKKFLEVPDDKLALWDDSRIQAGDKWKREIESALAKARIAVLLVTQSFFASKFIKENELPVLLRAAEEGGLTLLWIAWSPSRYKGKELEAYQGLNDPKVPLSKMTKAQREEALVRIAEEIRTLLQAPGRRRFLVVLGPSAPGKSSLLPGGLLPRLSSGSWLVEKMRP